MSRARLPAEGKLSTNMDDRHCIAAAEHAAANRDFMPTAAEALRIARGRELIAAAQNG